MFPLFPLYVPLPPRPPLTDEQLNAVRAVFPEVDDVPLTIRHEVPDAVDRALRAGARPGMTYLGAGMTAIVFGSVGPGAGGRGGERRAYKVGRHPRDAVNVAGIAAEAEWLNDAREILRGDLLDGKVVRFNRFEPALHCIVNLEVERVSRSTYGVDLWGIWKAISAVMKKADWGPPEFKEDSFVIGPHGPVLVDAGQTLRYGRRMLRFVCDILAGTRPWSESPKDLRWQLEAEISEGRLTPTEAASTIAQLVRLEPEER